MSETILNRALIVLTASYVAVILVSVVLMMLLSFSAAKGFRDPSRSYLRIGFVVGLVAFSAWAVSERFLPRYVGAGTFYSGPAYALIGVAALLLGISGYAALTSVIRYPAVMIGVWGIERIYSWCKIFHGLK